MRPWLLCFLGWLAILPTFVLLVVVVAVGGSWSGLGFALGFFTGALGLLASRGSRRLRLFAPAGLAIVLLTAFVRTFTGARGETISATGPDGARSSRLLGRILDEQDASVIATHALVSLNLLSDPEVNALPAAMRSGYRRMRATEGDGPSPLVPTYAGMESPGAFDVIVVDGVTSRRGALIFLHGFAGNFTLPCWQIAQAARRAGLVTFCPSTGWRGEWWTAEGEAILRRTLALVRARGLHQVWLAGLSNGAIGASRLLPRVRGAFRGMLLVSCAASDAPSPGVPTLVLAGRGDAMCPARIARTYATRTGASYVGLEGGHFVMLTREDAVLDEISKWLIIHG